jgi:hypothetical protein
MRPLPILILFAASCPALAAEFPRFEPQVIDPHVGNVCYAVTTADVDADGKPDVVAVAEDAVYWYQNPTWEKHTIVKGATERDNVCIQPHDIDADGRIDFALGASWQPTNTKTGGTLQVLTRTGAKDGAWRVVPIASEPTLHRIRWGDVLGTGKPQLVVAPLQGRDTKGPDWGAGQGVRLLVFSVPEKPFDQPWTSLVAADRLHTTHNLQITDFDEDGRQEIVVAGWEGVFVVNPDGPGRWTTRQIGSGKQDAPSSPSQAPAKGAAGKGARPLAKGASEVKVGRLKDGSKYVATIEPWHGYQVVVYRPGKDFGLWERKVVDEPLEWGHAVWCADLDGDGDEELVIGQRDPGRDPGRSPRGPGLFVYDPKVDGSTLAFERHVVDDGGVAVEDALAADLDGDGRPDLIAGGRATHNLKLYWNRPGR